MSAVRDFGVAALSGGAATFVLQGVIGLFKARIDAQREHHDTDIQLETHRDQLTFDLLHAAREEIAECRKEISELRPLTSRMAHLEEALDHIYALLHAEGDVELGAAERRARAYLRRMRPEIGDLRNAAQAVKSVRNVVGDIAQGGPE